MQSATDRRPTTEISEICRLKNRIVATIALVHGKSTETDTIHENDLIRASRTIQGEKAMSRESDSREIDLAIGVRWSDEICNETRNETRSVVRTSRTEIGPFRVRPTTGETDVHRPTVEIANRIARVVAVNRLSTGQEAQNTTVILDHRERLAHQNHRADRTGKSRIEILISWIQSNSLQLVWQPN